MHADGNIERSRIERIAQKSIEPTEKYLMNIWPRKISISYMFYKSQCRPNQSQESHNAHTETTKMKKYNKIFSNLKRHREVCEGLSRMCLEQS